MAPGSTWRCFSSSPRAGSRRGIRARRALHASRVSCPCCSGRPSFCWDAGSGSPRATTSRFLLGRARVPHRPRLERVACGSCPGGTWRPASSGPGPPEGGPTRAAPPPSRSRMKPAVNQRRSSDAKARAASRCRRPRSVCSASTHACRTRCDGIPRIRSLARSM